jgi:shikimate kinase
MTISRRHLVLVGPMAAGKTTLGRILACRLKRRFIDSDEQIADRFGMTSAEYSAEHGVEALHEAESRMLIDALSGDEPAVIAAAASIADSTLTISELGSSDSVLVMVEAPVELLIDRLAESDHRRPISTSEFAARTRDRREALVGLEPEAIVDTSNGIPQDSADRVLRLLGVGI